MVKRIFSLDNLPKQYKNKKALVLGCGPSLADVKYSDILELSKEYFIVTIKQTYFQFKELSHFQFFNCNNFMKYTGGNAKFICCSPSQLEQGRKFIWKDQKIDYFYQITSGKKLSQFDNLDDFFSKDSIGNFTGPGIMYEAVLPFLYNIGVSEILTVGWDYHKGEGYVEHFYDEVKRKTIVNPANLPYIGENAESIVNSGKVNKFFYKKGILLRCVDSGKCYLHDSIARLRI